LRQSYAFNGCSSGNIMFIASELADKRNSPNTRVTEGFIILPQGYWLFAERI
jgi:hypothetical protein